MDDDQAVSLDDKRAAKFLLQLAADPFLAVVVTDDGKVTIFSKDLSPDHLARIKQVLKEIEADQ